MKNSLLLALALFAAVSARAETKIATVNMELAVLAHPQTAANREAVAEKRKGFQDSIKVELEKLRVLRGQFSDAIENAQNVAASPASRDAAREEARKLAKQGDELERSVRAKLAESEAELNREVFLHAEAVKADIAAKLAALAAEKGWDLVLDSSATRTGLFQLSIVPYASEKLDATDDLIAAIGGDREAAEEALERGMAHYFGTEPLEGSDAPAGESVAAPAPAAPAAVPAAVPAAE